MLIRDKICYFNNQTNRIEVKQGIVYVNETIVNELGQGIDGIVYKYKDKAIKLYHDDIHLKLHLTKDEIERLIQISTKHIILPKEILIGGERTPGFVMDYIDINKYENILLADKKYILNEIKEIEEELILLGQKHFLLEDTKPENLFYNGKFYMFDPDSLIYEKSLDSSSQNLEVFVWHFFRYIVSLSNNNLSYKETITCINKLHCLYKKGNYTLLSDFLKDNIKINLIEQQLINTQNHLIKTRTKKINDIYNKKYT